jgi:hypothetical protein
MMSSWCPHRVIILIIFILFRICETSMGTTYGMSVLSSSRYYRYHLMFEVPGPNARASKRQKHVAMAALVAMKVVIK